MQQTYKEQLDRLTSALNTLEDKPEETAEATLKALWLMAQGEPCSAQAAEGRDMTELTDDQAGELERLIGQRLEGIPLAHLTGKQQFMGIELLASPDALVPRKETEILGNAVVELAQELAREQPVKLVIDVCTGAGNLAVAYAKNIPEAKVFAADLSKEAVELARRNVALLGLEDRVELDDGDLLAPYKKDAFMQTVDILSCNPPYISSSKVEVMPDEISGHEPRLAFDGGPFGIAILQRLMKEAPDHLRAGGWLAFEVGLGQAGPLMKRLEKNPAYDELRVKSDAQGQERVILARKAKA